MNLINSITIIIILIFIDIVTILNFLGHNKQVLKIWHHGGLMSDIFSFFYQPRSENHSIKSVATVTTALFLHPF